MHACRQPMIEVAVTTNNGHMKSSCDRLAPPITSCHDTSFMVHGQTFRVQHDGLFLCMHMNACMHITYAWRYVGFIWQRHSPTCIPCMLKKATWKEERLNGGERNSHETSNWSKSWVKILAKSECKNFWPLQLSHKAEARQDKLATCKSYQGYAKHKWPAQTNAVTKSCSHMIGQP